MAYVICQMAQRPSAIAQIRAGKGPGRQPPVAGLLDALDVPLRTLGDALQIPERTLHRLKQAPVVPSGVADKIARVHDVLARASEVLGSRAGAQRWVVSPNPAFGGAPPLSLLDTSLGWERVKDTLGRIEHGVPG
jgi:putative toxin-antitoxin system antitoxin component (TIGR02293 family)